MQYDGSLPFRYLGILPLYSKKLIIVEYKTLGDKITVKLTHWYSKLFSYAGKVELVNYVIKCVKNYLAR